MMTINLRAYPTNISIIQVYAPTTDADIEERDTFYEQLQEVYDEISKKDIIFINGDFNAKIGKDNKKNQILEFMALVQETNLVNH